VLITVVAGILFISHNTALAGRDKEEAKVEETKSEDAKLLYTFKDDKDMAEFEQLYVSKQATFG